MSLAVIYSRALSGMQAPLVEVEAHLANGLPAFNIVGLPDTEVKESRDRVRAAILQSGFDFPAKKITVNLAPADLPKESGRFDLPIALGVLAASGQIAPDKLAAYEFAGELALSGALRPVRGALAMAWQGMQAGRAFVLPADNAKQAALMQGIAVFGAESLGQVAAHLNGIEPLVQALPDIQERPSEHKLPDLQDVKGQHTARLALEIAAAGGHSLLMMGPPGTGKTFIAQHLAAHLAGVGIGFLPKSLCQSMLDNQQLVSRVIPTMRPPSPLSLAWRKFGSGKAVEDIVTLFTQRRPEISGFLEIFGNPRS